MLIEDLQPELEFNRARIPVASVEAIASDSGSFCWRIHFNRSKTVAWTGLRWRTGGAFQVDCQVIGARLGLVELGATSRPDRACTGGRRNSRPGQRKPVRTLWDRPSMLEAFESWDLTKPQVPKRSLLHPLEPIGIGTPFVESLTSYIARLAEVHAVTVSDLAGYVLAACANPRCTDRL